METVRPVDPGTTPQTAPVATSVVSEKKSRKKRRQSTSVGSPDPRMSVVWVMRVVIVTALLGIWEYASGRWVEDYVISSPSEVSSRFAEWVVDGTLLDNAVRTLSTGAMGFLIGGIGAVILGYLLGVSKFWAAVIEPIVTALWAVPRTALIPVMIVWVGIGAPLATTVAATIVFFQLFYNSFYGIREVPQNLIDSVRIMGGRGIDLALQVRLPSAFVWIVAGFKLSIPMAFVAVVTAEIVASNRGLGYLVANHAQQFDTTGAFTALVALLIIGLALDRAVGFLSDKILVWKER